MTTIADMLAQNATKYPDDTALIELKPSKNIRKEITWREFDERSNRIANALMDRGIKKGDKVIHWMMNSINWLEAYFGIIRTTMIIGEEFIERVNNAPSQLPTINNYIVVGQNPPKDMDDFEDMISNSPSEPVNIELTDEDGCGLYFSSGTTGEPKPILLSHKNMVCAAITEHAHHYQKHEDNFVLLPPLYHAGAKMHWFGNLIVGARASILTEISPQDIFEAIHKERGTIVWLLVPWAHDILVAMDNGKLKTKDYDLSCWRLMHIGAQPVPPTLVKHWKEYFPDMQYDTDYGLSEAAGPGCVHLGIENEHKVGAIGKAGVNWETRIVNNNGEDVAEGAVGELIVNGDGVMKEYYKNPAKTAKVKKDGWLYTGDIARMDSDGFIYLVDRKKDVVITGGENIYPAELEEVLHRHPKIYDVAVIGIPDMRLGEIAIAIIDPKPNETLTEAEVYAIDKPKLRQKYNSRR